MDDAEDSATAMAAAMGFSSFGAQKPNKRRKFNPSTDAFVDPISSLTSTVASTLPFHRYADNSTTPTGSNTVPLGHRKQVTNMDEIDLDDDEDDDDEDPEPQYLDTSRPSAPIVADPADNIQSKIDAIVGSVADSYTSPQVSSSFVDNSRSSRGGRRGYQRNLNRDGGSGTEWWEDYYDPAFIVNPWDKLEKRNGLEPRGAWVSWEEAKAART
ncbi:hypothetical protein ONZ43_g2059 [Nemania bipapillata]|uniref:Uncharacterized protein n=1 Tax=Nemania bipapillata TaxID=110536 RepID=A0ACC2J252_9PEZI|nr:hypothetical protein ONZ43_g2059 [Nemania bipapillata]